VHGRQGSFGMHISTSLHTRKLQRILRKGVIWHEYNKLSGRVGDWLLRYSQTHPGLSRIEADNQVSGKEMREKRLGASIFLLLIYRPFSIISPAAL